MVTYSENKLDARKLLHLFRKRYGQLTEKSIKDAQKELNVKADGYFGPKSIAAFLLTLSRDGIDRYTYTSSHRHRRFNPPISVVWHDSVTRDAKTCHRILERKGYGSHYYIDEGGEIYETMDPGRYYGIHAGAFNQESIGVDVCNLLSPRYLGSNGADNERRTRIEERRWGSRKRMRKVLRPTKGQKISIIHLAKYLSTTYDIPLVMPPNLTIYGEAIKVNDRTYHGHIAHGQLSSKRWDGLFVTELFKEQGWSSEAYPVR